MYITPRQKKRYIFNILFFALAIPLTVLAGYSAVQIISNASTEATPSNVALSNLTTNSLTITWTTPIEASGEVIVVNDGQQSNPFSDFRGTTDRKTHFIEIVDLSPDTTYSFIIKSNGNEYSSTAGSPFEFKTSPLTQDTPVPNPVYGTIPGDVGDDALVYIFTTSEPQSLPLSTVPASTGNWIADLSALRSMDGSGLVPVSAESELSIIVVGPDGTGSEHNGPYSSTFDSGGKLESSVDLTVTENPTVTQKLPGPALIVDVGSPGEPTEARCNESCSTTKPCESGLTCSNTVCRNIDCSEESDCTCPESPDPPDDPPDDPPYQSPPDDPNTPDPASCNESCGSSSDCELGLSCSDGACREPACLSESSCECPQGPTKPEFDPSSREFLIKQDVPWIEMFPGNAKLPDEVDPDEEPDVITGSQSIKVVNQSDNAFGITWVSDTDVESYVRYGVSDSTLGEEANDVRDSLVERGAYTSHLIEINDLEPETTYYYEVVAGAQTYNNNGEPFEFTTYETLSSPPPFETVSGLVTGAESIEDVVVLVQLQDGDGSGTSGDSNFVAVVLDAKGGWIASIGDVRNADGSEYYTYTDEDILVAALYIYAETSTIEVPVALIADTLVELEALTVLTPDLWDKFKYIFAGVYAEKYS